MLHWIAGSTIYVAVALLVGYALAKRLHRLRDADLADAMSKESGYDRKQALERVDDRAGTRAGSYFAASVLWPIVGLPFAIACALSDRARLAVLRAADRRAVSPPAHESVTYRAAAEVMP